VTALDHSGLSFAAQGELPAILTPLVEQVLDATYVSKDMVIEAPAPFNDTNAINVINGIVRVGEIPRGARPTRDISAAQNYGFALGIMRRPNDRMLDLSECRYTVDMAAWIEEKLADSGSTMPAVTVYKNFMGIGGPNDLNYGLSRRTVQLYLLCLVWEGKIRITLSGRNAPVEAIDYTNVATIDFKTAVLEGFDQIQRLKPPEGWELLAPFAAVLLDDESLRTARQDSQIQAGVRSVLTFKEDALEPFRRLRTGLTDLFQEIGRVNPLEERLAAWDSFLSSPVETGNPIPFLLNALDQAFAYHVFQDDVVRQEEVDDLKLRAAELGQAEAFFQHRDRLRAAAAYAVLELPDEPALAEIRATFQKARSSLENIDALMTNETRLLSQLLEPIEEAIQTYSVRYLQLFDQVTAHAEQVRQEIEALPNQPACRALGRLAQVEQLGADPNPQLAEVIHQALAEPPGLFPTTLSRAEVERRLRHGPQPPDCSLTLSNADEWRRRADDALARCQGAVGGALLDKAALLHSGALRERLSQGRNQPFIASLLACQTPEDVADYLAETLGGDNVPKPDPVGLLRRYLKKLRVRQLRMADFTPSKRTIERADVDGIAAEFRNFLVDALDAGEDELPVVELE
jgi:hypothetical protein